MIPGVNRVSKNSNKDVNYVRLKGYFGHRWLPWVDRPHEYFLPEEYSDQIEKAYLIDLATILVPEDRKLDYAYQWRGGFIEVEELGEYIIVNWQPSLCRNF